MTLTKPAGFRERVLAASSPAELLRDNAGVRPDSPAIVGDGRAVTHGELNSRSSSLAAGLVASGLHRGDRVCYLGRNATEYWELFFAAAKAGLVVVPLNFRLAPAEIEWILGDVEPAAILVEDQLVAAVPPAVEAVRGPKLWFTQEASDAVAPTGWTPMETFVADASGEDPRLDNVGDDLFCMMYSSGTTGRPKGVETTAGAFLWGVATFGSQFEVSETAVSLVPTPYYHIAAGGWSLIALAAGGRIVQFTEVTPQALLARMVGERATHVIMVPTVIQAFVTSPEASQADYSSVEWLVYGGSPISESTMVAAQRVFGAKLAQSYGLTETIGVTTILGPQDHVVTADSKLRSAGRAVPGVGLEVRDAVTGDPLPTGEVGEVVTRGPVVTRGYWRRPDDTASAFWADGWFRTGDAGYLDADGYLFLKDRIKDVISSGGENVYPAEVENAIMAHPDVLEVAVIGVPSDRWGESPHAVVVPRPGCSLDEAELIAHARGLLAGYKCPRTVEVVGALPRNPSGKVLKRALREPFWAGRDRNIS